MDNAVKINLGCGTAKLEGFINVDAWPGCEPDIVASLTEKLPFPDEHADLIVLSHVIEHIPIDSHECLLHEIRRILKVGGKVLFAYPEFEVCVDYFLTNHRGQREFWRRTLYGRQAHPGDFHVYPMVTTEFGNELILLGFEVKEIKTDPKNNYYTILTAEKTVDFNYREELLAKELFNAAD